MRKWVGLMAAVVLLAAHLALPQGVSAGAGTIRILGGEGVVSAGVANHLLSCMDGSVVRYGGADRFATAAAVSAATYPAGADAVFVATGSDFPDAVAAGSPAALADAPILLVLKDVVPSATKSELSRLKPTTIFVVGGEAVVSASVASQLDAYASGSVVRLAGTDRFKTAAAISKARFPTASTVYVAIAFNFPDALAGSVAAALDNAPVLLVGKDTVPSATTGELNRLSPNKIVILGGTGVVSPSVESALGAYATTVTRLAGADRFSTARAISQASFGAGHLDAFVATGENFPDALVGGAAGGNIGAPILLVTKYRVPSATAAEISRLFGHACSAYDGTPTPPVTFGNGIWFVGSEVPPGTYRNSNSNSNAGCYAARLSGFGGTFGEIIANEFAYERLVVTIAATDAGFESDDCGIWTNDIVYRSGSTSAPFGSGTWFVNHEVAPGTWRNNDSTLGCYWERRSGFSWELDDIIVNEFTYNISTVTISATDEGFYTSDCGTWTKVG